MVSVINEDLCIELDDIVAIVRHENHYKIILSSGPFEIAVNRHTALELMEAVKKMTK